MMEHLQKECDRQARKIIETFKENREFDKKVGRTNSELDLLLFIKNELTRTLRIITVVVFVKMRFRYDFCLCVGLISFFYPP